MSDRTGPTPNDFIFEGPLGSDGAKVEQIEPAWFKITLGSAPNHPEWPNKLNFMLKRVPTQPLVLEVVFDAANSDMAFNEYPQSYSPDGVNWTQVFWERDRVQSPGHDFLRLGPLNFPRLYVGTQTPLSNEQLMEKVARWAKSPFATLHTLGETAEGRKIVRLTITDTTDPHKPARRWAHHVSLQHPGEFNAQWRMVGMIEWLLSDDPLAAQARGRQVFHFVPTMSPDGPSHGWYRVNASGKDMNRTYLSTGADPQRQEPEAYLVHHDFEELMNSPTPITTAWAMHTCQGIVEPVMCLGPEIGTQTGPFEQFVEIMQKHDANRLIKPLRQRQGKPRDSSWGQGPFMQYGISNILCEGGSFFNKAQNIQSGIAIAKAICEFY